jgi:hypothetical protein
MRARAAHLKWGQRLKLLEPETEGIVTKLGFNTLGAAALIISGLGAIDEAVAGTESFRRTCHEIRISSQNGLKVINALCDDGRTTAQFEGFQNVENHFVVPRFGCRDIENRRGRIVCVGPRKDDRKAAGGRLPPGEIPY